MGIAYKGFGFGDNMNNLPNDKMNLPENKLKKAMVDKLNKELEKLEKKKEEIRNRKTEIIESVYGPTFDLNALQSMGRQSGKTNMVKDYMEAVGLRYDPNLMNRKGIL
jgi:uncharacterized protein (UPF0335 family)